MVVVLALFGYFAFRAFSYFACPVLYYPSESGKALVWSISYKPHSHVGCCCCRVLSFVACLTAGKTISQPTIASAIWVVWSVEQSLGRSFGCSAVWTDIFFVSHCVCISYFSSSLYSRGLQCLVFLIGYGWHDYATYVRCMLRSDGHDNLDRFGCVENVGIHKIPQKQAAVS